jgi:NAD(P)H-dependent FMN reductase
MNYSLYIPVLAGTIRTQRQSILAARFVEKIGSQIQGIKTELVDPLNFTFPGDGNDPEGKDPRYSEITNKADGFFIVTPEYNHSFPGSLKRMLDSELQNYIHKPVAFAGVSGGQWGGVRAIEALVMTVREMGMAATFTDMHFPNIADQFDSDGNPTNERTEHYVQKSWDELIWMARALKYGRTNL